ncbi:MAG: hypothetical protein IPP59_01190 [Betaproteobacteria bacterium]|nr:hypothetical protein [Betaproteobacteria bacterium]MBK9782924.1 hypothetical protein [Candidatus Dechloromonas phosphorivorans]
MSGSGTNAGDADKSARCNDCAHYYITHDTRFRYGCRALGFKSQQQPIRVVMEASAQQCHYFQRKK